MGRPVIDLTGNKYGKLTVLHRHGNSVPVEWECQCECGNIKITTGDNLKNGAVRSCGCMRKPPSLTGEKFGKLTVGESFYKRNKVIYYHCTCECGKSVDVRRYDLLDGSRQDCGSCEKRRKPGRMKDISGTRVGSLTVIERDPKIHITSGGNEVYYWICRCDCGNMVSISSNQIRRNNSTLSCGCLQAKKQGISRDEYVQKMKSRENTGLLKDLSGQKFGKLTALYRDTETEHKRHKTHWVCQCECGNTTIVAQSNLTNGHTCSCGCIDSTGEMYVKKYLTKLGVSYKPEHGFAGCVDKHRLPFDFVIYNNQNNVIGIIEYDGLQHFQPVRFNGMTTEKSLDSFKTGQKHDKMKNDFCKSNNIPLLRIKYTEINNIKELVHDFIDMIKRSDSCGYNEN